MKEEITTQNAPQPIGAYSQAIKLNNLIFLSGQLGFDPEKMEIIQSDFRKETEQVFQNIKALCEASSGNINSIVKLTIFLTDLNNFRIVNEVMMEVFSKPFPARSTIGVASLPKNAAIEVDAILSV